MSFTYDGTSWRLQDSDLMERMHDAETGIEQNATSITSFATMNSTYTDPQGNTVENKAKSYVDQTATGIRQTVSSTYATKTELSDNYVNKNDLDTRVEDEDTWLYRTAGGSTDITDGIARIESIKGNTVVWNQLVNGYIGTSIAADLTLNCIGNVIYISGQANNTQGIMAPTPFIATSPHNLKNHKILVTLPPEDSGVVRGSLYYRENEGAQWVSGDIGYKFGYQIVTIPNDATQVWIGFFITSGIEYDFTWYVNIFDLTQMFGAGNEPSTVAEFEALFPATYYPYDAGSLLNVNMKGVRTVGFNQWDEEWEVGLIDNTTGEPTYGTTTIRSKNFIPVFPGVEYYFKVTTSGIAYCYDSNYSYIGNIGFSTAYPIQTMLNNCRYMKFRMSSDYGTTYNNDICINISDSTRNGEYEPY